MIEVSALQNFVSRDCGRRRRRHHHHHPLRGRRRTRDRVAPVATSRRLSLGGRGEARRGPSTVGKVVNILEAGGLNRNPNLPSFILPWWTPDCRDFGLKKERKGKEKKKKGLGFSRLFKRYSKDRLHLLSEERRATGLLMGVWVCSALQEFKLYP